MVNLCLLLTELSVRFCWQLSSLHLGRIVPAGTKVSEFALGRWEGCNLLHGMVTRLFVSICMPQGCDGVQLVVHSIGPLCRHDITRSDRQIGNV